MRPEFRSAWRKGALAVLLTVGGEGFALGQDDPEALKPNQSETKRAASRTFGLRRLFRTADTTEAAPIVQQRPVQLKPVARATQGTQVRTDSLVQRAQAPAQPPVGVTPTAPAVDPVEVQEPVTPRPEGEPEPALPDLGVPAADRSTGGGEPTEEEAAEEAPEPTLLMKFLGMEDSPVKIYGWIQNSFTGNANGRPASGSNFGVNPNNRANQWMGNQYYVIVENPLEQNDEVNFGFRVDNLFGNDWQFNYMQGLFNRAFPNNYFAGYDMAQLYGEVHLPILTEGGFDIKGGRWYTIAGYEQVPAIARPLLSVPYMFNYGQPFTHFGALTTWHVTKKFNLYNGAINGWDRWINTNYKWGYIGGFTWTSEDDKTTVAFTTVWGPNQFPKFLPNNQPIYPTGYINIPTLAGQVNPGYATNDRTLFTTVLTRKWNDKLTQVMESDQGWERGVPGLGANPVGSNGTPRDEQWDSFGNWFLYQFCEKLTGVWRSEWFRDHGGARTGFSDNFYEFTLGMIYKPEEHIWIRPEIRYDWAQFTKPYNDGTRSSQLTLGFDVILLF